jgi:signal transduction histidine kinase
MKSFHVVLTSFFFILFVFFIAASESYRQYGQAIGGEHIDNHSMKIVDDSNEFLKAFLNLANTFRTEFLLGDQSVALMADSTITKADNLLAELSLTIDSESNHQKVLEEIKNLWQFWRAEFADPLLKAKSLANSSDSAKRAFNDLYKSRFSDRPMDAVQGSLQAKFAELMNADLRYHITAASRSGVEHERLRFFLPWMVAFIVGISVSVFVAYYLASRLNRLGKLITALTLGKYRFNSDEFLGDEFGTIGQELQYVGQVLESNGALLKKQKDDLDQIILTVAHEIKIPMRGISSALSWIEADRGSNLNNEAKAYLAMVRKQMMMVDEFLHELLKEVSRGGRVEKEYVHVGALLDDIMEQSVERRPGISLIKSQDLPMFQTDRLAFRQVLANLVSNAFKHHDKPTGVVKVSHRENGEFYEFFVEDDGPGVPYGYRDRIFKTFQTVQTNRESAGLGLAIVKKILTDRHLDMNLSSEPGKGSTFSFTWPR